MKFKVTTPAASVIFPHGSEKLCKFFDSYLDLFECDSDMFEINLDNELAHLKYVCNWVKLKLAKPDYHFLETDELSFLIDVWKTSEFLQCDKLSKLVARVIGEHINNKAPEEIRTFFQIPVKVSF